MSRETAKMSQTTREILLKVRKMVPPMLEKFHKGANTPPCILLQLPI
jgi:ATP-dependent NAD(P)H-hydrate dehydratase